MLGTLRRLLRLRGPLGVVTLAVGVGALAGLLVTHAVLAAWTYRDAARRDLRAPGRWALAVLVGGLFAFGPYVLWHWVSDASAEEGLARTAYRVVRERRGTGTDESDAVPAVTGDDETAPVGTAADRSLATTTARYGAKAAGLGVRGARWAGRRAVARMNNG